MSTPKARHTLDFGPLEGMQRLIAGHDGILVDIGKAVAAEFGARVRMGSSGKTATGEPIDPNSPGWALRKQLEGRDPNPLIYSGDMTEPNAWNVTTKGDVVTLTLNAEHQEKWDNIHFLRDGRNWDEVWVVGPNEEAVVLALIARYIEREIGL